MVGLPEVFGEPMLTASCCRYFFLARLIEYVTWFLAMLYFVQALSLTFLLANFKSLFRLRIR